MTKRRMLLGLIGANIQGSMSPALFADAFAAAGIDGFYHLLDVDRLSGRSLSQLLEALKEKGTEHEYVLVVPAAAGFLEKAAELLDRRIHLLIIDLLPPGPRDPHGIHAAIWENSPGRGCATYGSVGYGYVSVLTLGPVSPSSRGAR